LDLSLVARYLFLRRGLRSREQWSPDRLRAHQDEALRRLRAHSLARSPFYRRFHAGLGGRPLAELPVLTKAVLMANFDDLVTDREIRLADVEAHLGRIVADVRFRGRYRVVSTSGTTGLRGIFLSDPTEWAHVIASYARAQEWAGIVPSLRRPTRLAVISTTKPWHQSARVGASVQSPLVPTIRLDATDSMSRNVDRLNAFQPASLVAYASMHRLLAEEQLAGRLRVTPQAVMSASEVLTSDTRRLIADAWGIQPFDVYAASEAAGIASECEHHAGLHLYEDLVITEVVDENNKPVPSGVVGAKILVTVLFSRTQPLIRYELSDSVIPSERRCPCGRTFALIEGVQGRREDVIHLTSQDGGEVSIHPNVFHDVLDRVSAGEWQIVQDSGAIQLLVARPGANFDGPTVLAEVAVALAASGARVPGLSWAKVDAIPRTGTGKASLIRAVADSSTSPTTTALESPVDAYERR
jgi:putative adenylate-forming enzyme